MNSVHIDWAEAINFHSDKKIKSLEELESIYSQLQLAQNDLIIVFYHSGVRSAHTTFVLIQLLNYKNVKKIMMVHGQNGAIIVIYHLK